MTTGLILTLAAGVLAVAGLLDERPRLTAGGLVVLALAVALLERGL